MPAPPRRHAGLRAHATIFACLVCAANAGAAGINKCIAADGKVTYSDAACDEGTQSSVIEAPASPPSNVETVKLPASAPGGTPRTVRVYRSKSSNSSGARPSLAEMPTRPASESAGPALRPWQQPGSKFTQSEIETAVGGIQMLDLCTRNFPKFAAENARRIGAWKAQHAAAIRAAERDPDLARSMRPPTEPLPSAERGRFEISCEALAINLLGRSANTAGFETPRATWTRMVRSLGAGKLDAALESFSPDVRDRYRARLSTVDREAVRRKGFGTLESVAYIGDPATADLASLTIRESDRDHAFEVQFIKMLGRW